MSSVSLAPRQHPVNTQSYFWVHDKLGSGRKLSFRVLEYSLQRWAMIVFAPHGLILLRVCEWERSHFLSFLSCRLATDSALPDTGDMARQMEEAAGV